MSSAAGVVRVAVLVCVMSAPRLSVKPASCATLVDQSSTISVSGASSRKTRL